MVYVSSWFPGAWVEGGFHPGQRAARKPEAPGSEVVVTLKFNRSFERGRAHS